MSVVVVVGGFATVDRTMVVVELAVGSAAIVVVVAGTVPGGHGRSPKPDGRATTSSSDPQRTSDAPTKIGSTMTRRSPKRAAMEYRPPQGMVHSNVYVTWIPAGMFATVWNQVPVLKSTSPTASAARPAPGTGNVTTAPRTPCSIAAGAAGTRMTSCWFAIATGPLLLISTRRSWAPVGNAPAGPLNDSRGTGRSRMSTGETVVEVVCARVDTVPGTAGATVVDAGTVDDVTVEGAVVEVVVVTCPPARGGNDRPVTAAATKQIDIN
jgi:hypothetical protein